MKLKISLRVFLATMVFLLFAMSTCEKEDDPCEETKWEKTINYSVQPKLKPSQSHLPDDKVLKEALSLDISGYIKKIHCGGYEGTNLPISSSHDPRAIDEDHWLMGFYIGKVYGFDFDNDEDYLVLGYDITAIFEDGSQYKLNFPPPVLAKPQFAHDWDRDYFFVTISESQEWKRVQ